MAQTQPYPQVFMQQNKGTLMPGQMITVNKYTVQVDRYLSQGWFHNPQGTTRSNALNIYTRWFRPRISR